MNKWFVVFVFLFVFGAKTVFAEDGRSDATSRMAHLVKEMDELEKNQQQILTGQNEIINKLKNLKIQARR